MTKDVTDDSPCLDLKIAHETVPDLADTMGKRFHKQIILTGKENWSQWSYKAEIYLAGESLDGSLREDPPLDLRNKPEANVNAYIRKELAEAAGVELEAITATAFRKARHNIRKEGYFRKACYDSHLKRRLLWKSPPRYPKRRLLWISPPR